MVRRGKHVHIRRPHRLAIAAAPTLFGLAAAVCFSVQAAPAGAATTAPVTAHNAAAAGQTDSSSIHLMSVARQAAAQQAAAKTAKSDLPTQYTVRSGDSLAAISNRVYHNEDAWPVLYWANHRQIHWANEIETGQVLNVPVEPGWIPNPPALLGPPPAPAPAPVEASSAPEQAAPVQSAPVKSYVQSAPAESAAPAATYSAPAATYSAPAATYSGSGSFQSCVIAHESGGNSQVMNGSGHYGLYQFSAGTWAAYGGSASSFGNASVAQQNQVFNNAIAAGGQSNWAPYDGC